MEKSYAEINPSKQGFRDGGNGKGVLVNASLKVAEYLLQVGTVLKPIAEELDGTVSHAGKLMDEACGRIDEASFVRFQCPLFNKFRKSSRRI